MGFFLGMGAQTEMRFLNARDYASIDTMWYIPDTVTIKITNAVTSYVVKDGSEYLVISSKGRILERAKDNSKNLTELVCSDIKDKEPGSYLQFSDSNVSDILEGVERGVDFFDCVYPSRNGRHGHLYTNKGTVRLLNAKYELDGRPIEEGCGCPACRHYSRAYIRHLLKAKEMLGMRLCVMHNLYFYNKMMEEIRDSLDKGCFSKYKNSKLEGMAEYGADTEK